MLKYFFRNLGYILLVLLCAFAIAAGIPAILCLICWGGVWGGIAVAIIGILLVAYFSARKDFKDALEAEQVFMRHSLQLAYDNMIDELRSQPVEQCASVIKRFQEILAQYTITYTPNDPYAEGYADRYKALKVFYNLPD